MNLFYIAHWYFTRPNFLKSFFGQGSKLLSAGRFVLADADFEKGRFAGNWYLVSTDFFWSACRCPFRRLQQFPHALRPIRPVL